MSRQRTGLILGPALFALLLFLEPPPGMSPEAMSVAALAALMAVWWITEAIPIPATALLPIVLLPLLGVMAPGEVTASYGNHLIFLFMGGFFIAVTIQRWNLHRRIALHTIRLVGVTPRLIVLGFMLATAFLSMWISNTATAMMMFTIGLAVVNHVSALLEERGLDVGPGHFRFATSLMLGIAYAASIGGIATLIGTPPNVVFAGVIEQTYGLRISFLDWMLFALPLSIVMLGLSWWYLTAFAFPSETEELPGGRDLIRRKLDELGPMSSQEKSVLAVFTAVACAWIFRGLLDIPALALINDSTIAIAGAVLLFLIPSNLKKGEFLLDWRTAVTIPWDIIILFGGGFALANAFAASGLTVWLAGELELLQGIGLLGLVFAVVVLVVFLTEITSNTATATLLLPLMGALALAIDVHPYALMAATAIAASFAFMLPVATPPNAIVFSSRYVTIRQMAMAGVWLNILGCVLITALVVWFMPVVWGIDIGAAPAWPGNR
jgi:solute carrier family 13 (sodium-dependent dicarboxylate transporter), member 2/3/5